jgi:hypothetical protein
MRMNPCSTTQLLSLFDGYKVLLSFLFEETQVLCWLDFEMTVKYAQEIQMWVHVASRWYAFVLTHIPPFICFSNSNALILSNSSSLYY